MNGRVYFDGTAFFKDKTHLGSGATISDIRLGVSGKYENFSGKIDIGFAKKGISLKDVFIQYNFQKSSYARIGHFAEPFGLDYMESSGNIRFINAGCVTEAFAPGRKLGLEYIGWSKISGMPVVFLGILILTNGWIIKEMTVMPSLAVEFITLTE